MPKSEYGERDSKIVFLISPVRGVSDETVELMAQYIVKLANQGIHVYLPLTDTHQEDDPIGLRICGDNLDAIRQADEVHVWYSQTSKGSIFDFGMAFALGKKIKLANPEDVSPTEGKSFENMLLELNKRNR